jgi:hypothetical protein
MDIPVNATAANDKKFHAKENENLFTILKGFYGFPPSQSPDLSNDPSLFCRGSFSLVSRFKRLSV